MLCYLIVQFIFTLMPLYYEDGYFNMLQAKARGCAFGIISFLITILLWKLTRSNKSPQLFADYNLMDGCITALGMAALASCLCSADFLSAFWGSKGWCVGAFAYAAGGVTSMLLCRHLEYHHNLWLPIIWSNLIVFFVALLHGAGIDAFHLHQDVVPEQIFFYISTIGNLNWYVGYLCLLTPVFAVFYLSAREKATETLLLLFFVPMAFNLVLCASDGILLGLGVCAFFALPYVFAREQRMRRAFVMLTVFGAALITVGNLPLFDRWAKQMDGMMGQALDWKIALTIVIIGAVGAILVGGRWDRLPDRWKQIALLLAELTLAGVSIALLIHTVSHFDESWGTNRGRTWIASVGLYSDFSWKEKLLGVGPELLGGYYQALSTHFSRPILSAHSEPLQILLTMGGVSLLARASIWCCIFVRYFRLRLWRRDEIAFFLPLAAYWGQSLVNSPQPLNEIMFWVMLALFRLHTESSHPVGC